MKKINILMLLLIVVLTMSCEKLDNYDDPKERLTGRLTDQMTGDALITEQPNGFRIKMSEISWSDNPEPEYFWGKADGTFNNTKIFAGTYEITPVEGAFFPVEAQTLEIKGTMEIEFKVIPYLSVSVADIKRINDETIEITYTIARKQIGDKILDSRVFISTNPNVGTNILDNDLSPLKDLKDIPDEEILQTTFKETIKGFVKGKTYYVRVGARTDNANKRYNFTKVIKVD